MRTEQNKHQELGWCSVKSQNPFWWDNTRRDWGQRVLNNIEEKTHMILDDEQIGDLYEGDDGIIEADYGDDIVDRILDGELIQVEMI